MVERPAPSPARFAGDRLLAVNQHEAARVGAIHLIARQKCRKARQQFLEIVLRGEARRLHRHEGARLGQHEDTGSRLHVRRSLFRVRGAASLKLSQPAPAPTAVQIAPLGLEVEDERRLAETMEIVGQ